MEIIVLVKPVPDPDKYNEIQIDPVTKRIMRQDAGSVIDPASRNALEEAIKIRDDIGGRVTAVSMAPESGREKLMESLAMGADEAFLICAPEFAGADTYATSYVLAEAIRHITGSDDAKAFDLILAGNESADGATSHVPVQVAEWLGVPHVTGAASIITTAGEGHTGLTVTRKAGSEIQEFTGKTPALISVARDINKPRHISAMGIVKARKKPLHVLTNEELGIDPSAAGEQGSPTKAGELVMLDMSRGSAELTAEDATAEDAAKAILSLIRKAGISI